MMTGQTTTVICTTDWSACQPHTIQGQRATLQQEYFRNGEFQMKLVAADGVIFESPSVFWEREKRPTS